jgi:hypothetical protein
MQASVAARIRSSIVRTRTSRVYRPGAGPPQVPGREDSRGIETPFHPVRYSPHRTTRAATTKNPAGTVSLLPIPAHPEATPTSSRRRFGRPCGEGRYTSAFGIPGLGIAGVPVEPFFWGIVTLTLLYSAYVSEVYRAGIESVHPSQDAAARSLGLSRFQSLRHVVLPQAVRRVIPPLLNDFIGLQKDTVLVSFIGVVEIFRTAQIKQMATFNFTPYLAVALVFIAVTFPLARVVDWLVARDRTRAAAGM